MMITELGYKFLAILITLSVLMVTGYTTYPVIGYIMLAFFIYIYCSVPTTEDMLFRILLITTIYFVLSYVFEKHKEGFFITPSRLISRNMTAKQCQDYCGRNKHCKYANVPRGTSMSGRKGLCYNSYGQGQRHYGSKNRYYDTWQNKRYVQPPPPKPPRLFKHGEFIAIKSVRNNQWLAAEKNGQIGRRKHRMGWETFRVHHHPNGNPKQYLLESYHSGKTKQTFLTFNNSQKWRNQQIVHFYNASSSRPTKNWTWQQIEFRQKNNGKWGIYNPHHKKYLNGNHKFGLGISWHGRDEEFNLYKVPSHWGRNTREWNDKPISASKATLPLKTRYGRYRSWNPPFRHKGNRGGTIWKLGRCEGDCDSDRQCMPGLKCKQRNGYEKVQGCSGKGIRGWDYCYDPSM